MGLREKVALTVILIIFIQILFVSCSPKEKKLSKSNSNKRRHAENNDSVTQSPIVITIRPQVQYKTKARRKQVPDKNHEEIRKQFNFPDVDYPTASTPRPPFYLQETNILQRNPVQRTVAYPTSTPLPYQNQHSKLGGRKEIYSRQKYLNNLSNTQTLNKPGISYPEYVSPSKPYNIREGGFPNVEYPTSGKDIRIPNNWKQSPRTATETRMTRDETDFINPVNSDVPTRRDTTDQNNIDNTESYASKSKKQKARTSKTKKAKKKNTTPTPIQDYTESTTPFVLTPYTTLFFDTTPLIMDSKSSPEHSAPKKSGGKKKLKVKSTKKDETRTKDTESFQKEESLKTTTPIEHTTENNIACYSFTPPLDSTTSLPQETTKLLTISKYMHEPEQCTYISNDTMLSTFAVTTTPSYHDYDINLTPTTPFTVCNDEGKPAAPNDNIVASIYDAEHLVPKNIYSNDASCSKDNVINSNKSSSCDSNINNSALSLQDANVPAIDEEFTTDSYLDSDENILPAFTVTTSTLSPLTISTVDDTWVNSDVIDPYKSLPYLDELDEYYIMLM